MIGCRRRLISGLLNFIASSQFHHFGLMGDNGLVDKGETFLVEVSEHT